MFWIDVMLHLRTTFHDNNISYRANGGFYLIMLISGSQWLQKTECRTMMIKWIFPPFLTFFICYFIFIFSIFIVFFTSFILRFWVYYLRCVGDFAELWLEVTFTARIWKDCWKVFCRLNCSLFIKKTARSPN